MVRWATRHIDNSMTIMPRDQDEDVSSPYAPLGGAEPPVAPRAAPVAKPLDRAQPLVWGVCGVMHQAGELSAYPGGVGVIRYVNSGVAFAAPPVGGAGWRPVTSEPGRYDAMWEGDPTKARTLATLRTEIEKAVRRKELDSESHPLLRELDTVALGLATIAAGLHQQRWSLGMIRPDNVLLKPSPSGLTPVLVDLGFSWRSEGKPPWDDSPGRPAWIESEGSPVWLWDQTTVYQQFADPANGLVPPADEVADVKTLARLLAWLLAGSESRTVPEIENADYWQTLVIAAAGRVPTAERIVQRLREFPLSEHFAKPIDLGPIHPFPVKRSPLPKVLLIAVPLVVLAVAGGVAAVLQPWKPKAVVVEGPPTDPIPELPKPPGPEVEPPVVDPPPPVGSADLTALLAGLDEAIKASDIAGMVEKLSAIYKAGPNDKAVAVEKDRGRMLAIWIKQYGDAVGVAADPAKKFDAAKRFAELHGELKKLADSRPANDPKQRDLEDECLKNSNAYAVQLGSR